MREDFCAFILTHGRPDRVHTLETLRAFGYTGKVYLVVDDEDRTRDEYVRLYGDAVLTFSKEEIARRFDEGDNFQDRRAIFYARNACFDLARQVGCRYFIQLDDDYTGLYFRFDAQARYGVWRAECLDDILAALLDYYETIPALSICISQGGDHIGGASGSFGDEITAKRKAMNTFICSVDRPFAFVGRINEDVNTYALGGRRGDLFLTIPSVQVNQKQTQSNAGGMTDLYKDSGTYVKSFYSVMYAPSCASVAEMGSSYRRIHHRINWPTAAVKIVHERHRKALSRLAA
ncbi:MAG TPA: hypothetical protein VKA61_02350 [Sphingomicrobium sp.]|nr:hypothetical protein [Sphingomicrobium sp.]